HPNPKLRHNLASKRCTQKLTNSSPKIFVERLLQAEICVKMAKIWVLGHAWNRFSPFAHGHQFWFHLQMMHFCAYLSIGGKFHWLALFLRQAHRHLLHFGMLPDRRHG